jgi:hypothetical protein
VGRGKWESRDEARQGRRWREVQGASCVRVVRRAHLDSSTATVSLPFIRSSAAERLSSRSCATTLNTASRSSHIAGAPQALLSALAHSLQNNAKSRRHAGLLFWHRCCSPPTSPTPALNTDHNAHLTTSVSIEKKEEEKPPVGSKFRPGDFDLPPVIRVPRPPTPHGPSRASLRPSTRPSTPPHGRSCPLTPST